MLKETRRMTQEEFEMYANLAVSLHGRMKEGRRALERAQSARGPVCANLDEAYEYVRLEAEVAGMADQLQELAGEMAAAGLPLKVWIRVERGGGECDAKVRVTEERAGEHRLWVER